MKRIFLALIIALSAIVAVSAADKKEKEMPRVIDFNATWCGPCRTFKPVFEKVAKDYSKKARFISVDVDKAPNMAQRYGVRSIPHIVVLDKKGNIVGQRSGAMTEEEFEAFIKESLKL